MLIQPIVVRVDEICGEDTTTLVTKFVLNKEEVVQEETLLREGEQFRWTLLPKAKSRCEVWRQL